MLCVFFFSSRRRHTRWPRDWSSDVCSSDLDRMPAFLPGEKLGEWLRPGKLDPDERADLHAGLGEVSEQIAGTLVTHPVDRAVNNTRVVDRTDPGLVAPIELG